MTARERLHAMESFAAVIAHELRAGVMGVTSAAQLLRYSVPQVPVAEKSLGRILQESERLTALLEALTEYATELPPRRVASDPDAAWAEALRAMRGTAAAKTVLLTHSPSNPVISARLDPDQLTRAFERSVQHALGRVNAGGEIDVVSSADAEWWTCTISTASVDSISRQEVARPTLPLVLARRAIDAHGGDLVEHDVTEAPLLLTIRLPLSLHAE
jgi:signal transduction histidine kinase